MTFYDVYISSANLSGSATNMGNLIAGMNAFEESLSEGHWKNAPIGRAGRATNAKDSRRHSAQDNSGGGLQMENQARTKQGSSGRVCGQASGRQKGNLVHRRFLRNLVVVSVFVHKTLYYQVFKI